MAKKAPRKGGRTRGSSRDGGGDGIVARALERAFANPATTGGLLVMGLTAAAIVSNALFLQDRRQPDPLFGSDAAMPTGAISPAVASLPAEERPRPASIVIIDPPLPNLAPRRARQSAEAAAAPAAVPDPVAIIASADPADAIAALPPAPAVASPEVALVTDVQRELARIGLYNGAIDGLAGERTSAAIRAFEVAAGLAETGAPSNELLAALRAPLPPRETHSIATSATDSAAEELNRRERERSAMIAAEEERLATSATREATLAVQTALNRIGYGPLPVDGVGGTDTADAIRRFELDHGLTVTGQPGDALIARLIAIGAIRPG